MKCALTTSSLWLSALVVTATKNPQTPFLREVVLGRCYDHCSTSEASCTPQDCPPLIDDLIGSFQGRLDKDVTPRTFGQFFSKIVDFAAPVPQNAGLLVIGAGDMNALSGFVTPEQTMAGLLMDGLVFCANNVRDDCPRGATTKSRRRLNSEQEQQAQQAAQQQQQQAQQEQEQQAAQALMQQQTQDHPPPPPPPPEPKSEQPVAGAPSVPGTGGTQASYWFGVYSRFAASLQGRVTVLLVEQQDGDDYSLFQQAALPNFTSAVTGVDVYVVGRGGDCSSSPAATQLQSDLAEAGIDDIQCQEDPYMLRIRACGLGKDDSQACKLVSQCEVPTGAGNDEQDATRASNDSHIGDDQVQTGDDQAANVPIHKKKKKLGMVAFLTVLILLGLGVAMSVGVLKVNVQYDAIPDAISRPYRQPRDGARTTPQQFVMPQKEPNDEAQPLVGGV